MKLPDLIARVREIEWQSPEALELANEAERIFLSSPTARLVTNRACPVCSFAAGTEKAADK